MILRGFQLTLGTRRGLRLWGLHTLAAFGLVSTFIQFDSAVRVPDKSLPHFLDIELMVVVGAVIYGLFRTWPRRRVRRTFGRPDITVEVRVGDLFDQDAHQVIGFNDVFDTDTTDGLIISPASVQGQFLQRVYKNDLEHLDRDLARALKGIETKQTELRSNKQQGKRKRYPMGTVATLGDANRRFFCVAYSTMRNNLSANSTVDDLWRSLDSLWEAVYLKGQRRAVAIPIVGSELAKIECMDRESLLRMILLSYVARSRIGLVCKELIVVIHPHDHARINMLEVDAFLRSL